MKYILYNRKEGICDYALDLDDCPRKTKESVGEIVLVTDAAPFVGKKNYSGKLFCFHRFFCVDDKLHKKMQRISAQRHWKC